MDIESFEQMVACTSVGIESQIFPCKITAIRIIDGVAMETLFQKREEESYFDDFVRVQRAVVSIILELLEGVKKEDPVFQELSRVLAGWNSENNKLRSGSPLPQGAPEDISLGDLGTNVINLNER